MNIIVLLLLITSIYFIFYHYDRKFKINRKIPGPLTRNIPIIGNFYELYGKASYLEYQKFYKKYGKIYMIRLGNVDTVVLTGHSIIKEAFVKNSVAFSNRFQLNSRLRVSNWESIITSNFELHRKLKKLILSSLTVTKVKMIEPIFAEESIRLFEILDSHCKDGKPFLINDTISKNTMNVFIRFIFGDSYKSENLNELQFVVSSLSRFARAIANPIISDFIPLYERFDNSDYKAAYHHYFIAVYKLIESHNKNEEALQQSNGFDSQGNEDEGLSLIDKLKIQVRNGNITKNQMIHSVGELLGGGAAGIGRSIYFALHNLACNLTIQNKLYNDINSSLDKQDRQIHENGDSVFVKYSKYRTAMPYLSNVMKETFRKHPIAPNGLPHLLIEDAEISGYKIAAGTHVIQNVYSTQREEKKYQQPSNFIPERFDDSNVEELVHFGMGVRDCLGRKMAESQIFSTLATLIHRYEFHYLPTNPDYNKSLLLPPPQHLMIIKKRK